MINFTILGNPKGKGRPRATSRGKFVRMYTPPETAQYENLVRLSFQHEKQKKLDGAIGAEITAFMPIPKSMSKKKQKLLNIEIFPTKKPDFDNIGKIICDSLNGLAFDDDKQIVDAKIIKRYSKNPRVEVKMFNIGGVHVS